MRNKWFSTIIALLITAFLIVLSSGVLQIMVQESKNTRIVTSSITTFAWAEWALEYWLYKIKNHSEWFEDKIIYPDDGESKILVSDTFEPRKSPILQYEMNNFKKSYSWTILPWDYEIIPLFFDSWALNGINSKSPFTKNVNKTLNIKLSTQWEIVWNILWNDTDWISKWITWIGKNVPATFWTDSFSTYSTWSIKISEDDSWMWDWIKKESINWSKDIRQFLTENEMNYLILFNPTESWIGFKLDSTDWFSSPNIEITWTSILWDYKQNIQFSEKRSSVYDILKYSIYSR